MRKFPYGFGCGTGGGFLSPGPLLTGVGAPNLGAYGAATLGLCCGIIFPPGAGGPLNAGRF